MKKMIIIIVTVFTALWVGSAAEAAIIVGRISHVEGDIYRYMEVDESWVATQLQSPAGTEDVLATGPGSRVEITFPNDLLLRLDENTEIEILELDDDLGVFVLSSGMARFYNRTPSGKLVIETVRGTAKVAPGSIMDMRADGRSVVVSAVSGEATFQSVQNREERLEVISGPTSLEFREESIVAGTGPINWNWGSWCAAREEAWLQNRLVRSEYLPESMQEYASEIEPYGSWNRVYYRGYYYWAWRPSHVAVGWSPYTTGYWYDWHGSPVWMDHNPWGWVTHHHGHWIDMNGAWMWTPYVHVSQSPGVTVVGFNITFGKAYRSYWHPGRVRWISHNDYIGWFPLAPWETYYGYRRWGPGTVLVHGGPVFSLSINLSQHKYIDHAVIIPNRHLHTKGPVLVNNYNTVKIRNINKTVIVKDYKPLLTAERERARTHAVAKPGAGNNAARRPAWTPTNRQETRAAEIARQNRPEKRDDRFIRAHSDAQKDRDVQETQKKGSGQTVAEVQTKAITRNRQETAEKAAPEKSARIERQAPEPKIARQEKPVQRESKIARVSPEKAVPEKRVRIERQAPESKIARQEKPVQRESKIARVSPPQESKPVAKDPGGQKRTRASLQTMAATSSSRRVVQKYTAAAGKSGTGKTEQVQRSETPQPQKQVAGNNNGVKRAESGNSRKYAAPEPQPQKKTAQQSVRNGNNSRDSNGSRERSADRQIPGKGWFSTSMNERRMQ